MEKAIKKREAFIKLRAEGLSYEKISKEIGVSKPTLIKWSKQGEKEIKEAAKNIEIEFLNGIRDQANMRQEKLVRLMDMIYKNFTEMNYDALSDRELINVITKLEGRLKRYLDILIGEEPRRMTFNIIRESKKNKWERKTEEEKKPKDVEDGIR